ncbi:MAG: hypothetical protein A2157_13180 [Deltaproteobacteria bacterium RBG_16_47_11]|nr:MAG: hypothetical protein A2157_13180 [Deltaproteobacteria bacterium RBG_16_47_11]
MKKQLVGAVLVVVLHLLAASALAIDIWDEATIKDNSAGSTINQLQYGVLQTHDLEAVGGVADEDWYVIAQGIGRSYQVTVTQLTGDVPISNADFLTLWDSTGTTLYITAGAGTTGKTFRWIASASATPRVCVKGSSTTTSKSQYSIVFDETTLSCPRFNNAGTQVSVLIIQNTFTTACDVTVRFFNEAGALLGTHDAPVGAYATLVLPAASVPNISGQKGSVQVSNYCNVGSLKGKLVALEPATGFSFDTICETR